MSTYCLFKAPRLQPLCQTVILSVLFCFWTEAQPLAVANTVWRHHHVISQGNFAKCSVSAMTVNIRHLFAILSRRISIWERKTFKLQLQMLFSATGGQQKEAVNTTLNNTIITFYVNMANVLVYLHIQRLESIIITHWAAMFTSSSLVVSVSGRSSRPRASCFYFDFPSRFLSAGSL